MTLIDLVITAEINAKLPSAADLYLNTRSREEPELEGNVTTINLP